MLPHHRHHFDSDIHDPVNRPGGDCLSQQESHFTQETPLNIFCRGRDKHW
jgi:hypothetical protein